MAKQFSIAFPLWPQQFSIALLLWQYRLWISLSVNAEPVLYREIKCFVFYSGRHRLESRLENRIFWGFYLFYSVPSGKFRDSTLNYIMTASFHILSS
jgi:hypothetical protein